MSIGGQWGDDGNGCYRCIENDSEKNASRRKADVGTES